MDSLSLEKRKEVILAKTEFTEREKHEIIKRETRRRKPGVRFGKTRTIARMSKIPVQPEFNEVPPQRLQMWFQGLKPEDQLYICQRKKLKDIKYVRRGKQHHSYAEKMSSD